MLLTSRLICLIETHSHALAKSVLEKVQASPYTRSYSGVPAEELERRVYEIQSAPRGMAIGEAG
jgi:hypothetical protein